MSNMSDCRFRHIVTDLSDCEDAIDELFNGVTGDGHPLSDDELRAARQLVTSCINIVTLVADMAHVDVDLDAVEQSIETVLRKANSAHSRLVMMPATRAYYYRSLRNESRHQLN